MSGTSKPVKATHASNLGTIAASCAPTLAEIGAALYGDFWQRPMARDLGRGLRTVHRWAAVGRVPDDTVMRRLLDLLTVRRAELGELIISARAIASYSSPAPTGSPPRDP